MKYASKFAKKKKMTTAAIFNSASFFESFEANERVTDITGHLVNTKVMCQLDVDIFMKLARGVEQPN